MCFSAVYRSNYGCVTCCYFLFLNCRFEELPAEDKEEFDPLDISSFAGWGNHLYLDQPSKGTTKIYDQPLESATTKPDRKTTALMMPFLSDARDGPKVGQAVLFFCAFFKSLINRRASCTFDNARVLELSALLASRSAPKSLKRQRTRHFVSVNPESRP